MSVKILFLFLIFIDFSYSLGLKKSRKIGMKTKAVSQAFVVDSIIYESQCSQLKDGFTFSIELTTTSKYSATFNNIFPLISTNSSESDVEIKTICYITINDDEILCQTLEDVSSNYYGPFKVKDLTETYSFECEDSSGNSGTCTIYSFEDDTLVGYSLLASILMEQESPQYIYYQNTDKGSFQIDYEYYNGYAPIVYLNDKEVECDEGTNQLTCYVDKTDFSVNRGNTVAYDVTILNDCGIVEDIGLEVDIINKATTTTDYSYNNKAFRLKVDFVFLFVLFLVLI